MRKNEPINVTIWCAARGGMRSVVEAYRRDGFVAQENIQLIASYADGGIVHRQIILVRAMMRYVATLATRRVSLVHCHAAMRGSFWRKGLFASLARLFRIPVILHLHGSEMKPFYRSQPSFLQAMIRRHLEKATCVLVLSESWRAFIGEIAPAAKVVILPNYVPLPTRPAADRTGKTILFLGLVGDRKGVFDLIPAFAQVHRRHPDARLVIGGNGDVARARAMVDSLGLGDAVTLAGWVDGAGKAALLDQADIYTLPSYNEGLPMSVLEAMAEGLPVVTSHAGGLPELIENGRNGLLVAAGDREGLATALGRLLDDGALRRDMGDAARDRIAQGYSDKVILPQLAAIYRTCIATAQ
ncbi:glycosyltransferase family 4 protein [Sphingobium sp.]|uniref:glycosyltransferase family 4 protein n=1 Tax=Sphingobium sp. TaxID=1912891 RepID=UPI003B3BA1B5